MNPEHPRAFASRLSSPPPFIQTPNYLHQIFFALVGTYSKTFAGQKQPAGWLQEDLEAGDDAGSGGSKFGRGRGLKVRELDFLAGECFWGVGQVGRRRRGGQILSTSYRGILFKFAFPPSMSAKIILDNIIVKNSQEAFQDSINFQVTFTALEPLLFPLSWKIIYVGSALSEDFDQTLEEFDIGPIENKSTLKFDISCSSPDPSKIPRRELLCVTALILTASYRAQEFIRVGYYVHNQLQEQLQEDFFQIPLETLIPKIRRTIINDKPRVTKFNIDWSEGSLRKRGFETAQDNSQSILDDFFSGSNKDKPAEDNSDSQRPSLKEHEKQWTNQESNPINAIE